MDQDFDSRAILFFAAIMLLEEYQDFGGKKSEGNASVQSEGRNL